MSPDFDDQSSKREYLVRETMKMSTALTTKAYLILRDWSLAEDALQETLVVVVAKSEEFDGSRPLFPWVRSILRFQALNILKKQNRGVYLNDEELYELIDRRFDEYLRSQHAAESNRRKDALEICLMKLDAQRRQLLLGFYRDGIDCQTLGEMISKSANAIRIILSRLRDDLRECIRKQQALPQ